MRKSSLKLVLPIVISLAACFSAVAQDRGDGHWNRWEISIKNSAMPYATGLDILGEEDLGYFGMSEGPFTVQKDVYYLFESNPRMKAVELSGRLSRRLSLSLTLGTQDSARIKKDLGTDSGYGTVRFVYVIPELKFDWFIWRGASLYSSVAYGWGHTRQVSSGGSKVNDKINWGAFELVPVGLYYGYGNVFAFIEAGVGFHRIAPSYGIGVRF